MSSEYEDFAKSTHDEKLAKIFVKINEHDMRISHLEDMHKNIIQIQQSILTMNNRLIRVEEKVDSLDSNLKDTQEQNKQIVQKLVNVVSNSFEKRVDSEEKVRLKKWEVIEKWVMRVIIIVNTILLAYIGSGGSV